ncbi:hypothetical protein FRC10_011524, partial [Ceratobasidium sp. 414]
FRNFINASGTDDVLQRLAVLWLMALLIGYTANASAIKLGSPESTSASSSTIRSITGNVFAETGPNPLSGASHTRDPALVAAVAFFLVGKLSRAAILAWYATTLPLFRTYFLLQVLYQMLNFLVYFPILFVRDSAAIITLATLGVVTDYFPRYFSRIPMHMIQKKFQQGGQLKDLELSNLNTNSMETSQALGDSWKVSFHIPATNIKHFVERTAAFVVIVLGEIVLSVVYIASEAQTGVSSVYGTALCALLVAFNFCWLYFDAECSQEFVHAMHRHWFTSVTYTNLHFPLCASLIIVAAATYKMTQRPDKITPAIGWYFSGGLGVALISLALIGITHRGLDPKGTTRLGRVSHSIEANKDIH